MLYFTKISNNAAFKSIQLEFLITTKPLQKNPKKNRFARPNSKSRAPFSRTYHPSNLTSLHSVRRCLAAFSLSYTLSLSHSHKKSVRRWTTTRSLVPSHRAHHTLPAPSLPSSANSLSLSLSKLLIHSSKPTEQKSKTARARRRTHKSLVSTSPPSPPHSPGVICCFRGRFFRRFVPNVPFAVANASPPHENSRFLPVISLLNYTIAYARSLLTLHVLPLLLLLPPSCTTIWALAYGCENMVVVEALRKEGASQHFAEARRRSITITLTALLITFSLSLSHTTHTRLSSNATAFSDKKKTLTLRATSLSSHCTLWLKIPTAAAATMRSVRGSTLD